MRAARLRRTIAATRRTRLRWYWRRLNRRTRPRRSTRGHFAGGRLENDVRRVARTITPKARKLLRAIADENLEHGEALGRRLRLNLGDVNEGTLGGWAWSISSACNRYGLDKEESTRPATRAARMAGRSSTR